MDAQTFEKTKSDLQARGFEPAMLHVTGWSSTEGDIPAIPLSKMWEVGNDMMPGQAQFQQQEIVTTDPIPAGTPGLGAVCWGPNNDMPQRIDQLVNALPYTSQGISYLHDVIMGLGPQLQWHTAVMNEQSMKIEEVTMPYQHAGVWLRSAIRRAKILKFDEEEIKELEADYKAWQEAAPMIDQFLLNNDVLDWFDKLVMDYVKLGMCFPLLLLSLDRWKDSDGNIIPWNPTVKRVGTIPSVVGRLEQRDKKLRINYVLHAEKWRNNNDPRINQDEAVAYPTLWPKNFLPKFNKMVYDAREVSPGRRPNSFCAPISHCDNINAYYPWMPWWSIFTSKAYAMAASYMADKAIARNNNNMWGKMVFVNNEYLRALYSERGADTAEERMTIRKQVWDSINKFLKDKENKQKTLCLDSVLSPDGKTMMNAIEVVDVPGLSESADMKEALEEITSVIFFGLGIQPGLIGAIPGKTTSNSGTYQRELTLLKQNQLAPVQQKFLRLLDLISHINGWDTKHFKWTIRQQTLTTLDRNPEGKIEQNVH